MAESDGGAPLSSEDLNRIRAAHQASDADAGAWCLVDRYDWPCTASRLLADLEAARRALAFYADEDNWDLCETLPGECLSTWLGDGAGPDLAQRTLGARGGAG